MIRFAKEIRDLLITSQTESKLEANRPLFNIFITVFITAERIYQEITF